MFGDGSQSRCFTHVSDAVTALLTLADRDEAFGGVFNIGTSEEVTIAQLAAEVKRLTGSSSRITFIPYDKAYEEGFEDMPRRVPDTSKLRALTGYRPSMSLEETIRSVIQYFSVDDTP